MERLLVRARREWRQTSRLLLDVVLPPSCVVCRQGQQELCDECRRSLVARAEHACRRCGEPVVPNGRCLADHRRLRGLARLLSPYRFVGTGGALVRRFKLDGDATAGRLLASAMAAELRGVKHAHRPILVPVPLHRRRLRERGFDQALWLSRRIVRRLGMRDGGGVLGRRRATLPQGDARVLSRTENLRGAFVVHAPERVNGREVVLVDDVFTTGATARLCAKLLRDAGARSVTLLVACRS